MVVILNKCHKQLKIKLTLNSVLQCVAVSLRVKTGRIVTKIVVTPLSLS